MIVSIRNLLLAALAACLAAAGVVATRLNASTSPIAACKTVAGAIADDNPNICHAEPESYKTVIYEMGLCRSAPNAPTVNSALDLSNCVVVVKSAAGLTVSVRKGLATALDSSAVTAPPAGSYTHGYALLSPSYEVAGTFTFQSARQPRYAGSGTGIGTKCWTKPGVVFANAAPRVDMPFDCGSNPPATPGAIVSHINSFDGFSQQYSYQRQDVEGKLHQVHLLTSDLKLASSAGKDTLGTAGSGVDRMVGIMTLPAGSSNPVSNMDLSFSISEGATVIFDSTVGGVKTLYGILSGPPTTSMTFR